MTARCGRTAGPLTRATPRATSGASDRGKAEELYRLDNTPPKQKERMKQRAAAAQRAEEKRKAREKNYRSKPEGGFVIPDPDDDPEAMLPDDQADQAPDPLPTDRPYLPITQIIERKQSGEILVVSFSDLYKTDAALRRWSKIHTMTLRYRGGRPDSVGAYPSIRSIVALERSGKSQALLFGTRLDGLILLSDGKETQHALTGQFGADYVAGIENTAEGTLVVGARDEEDPWRWRDGKWQQVSFAPPFELAPDDDFGEAMPADSRQWSETRLLIGRQGAITTVSSTGWSNGTRTTALWRNGKSEVLGRECSDLYPSSTFITPDGKLWGASMPPALSFTGGKWTAVGQFELPHAGRNQMPSLGTGLRAVGDSWPPLGLVRPRSRAVAQDVLHRAD